ncbi:hypothetical protein scyTo_0003426 [Scyliorhinus torazame]|uniref:Uncharacterized protein n=1 Tax=Scyliorhinus torazame TaxID=75743 RepID=A0A401PMI7_SCYTO|nr:hypothetical protein [Scyliorhinus torazame]
MAAPVDEYINIGTEIGDENNSNELYDRELESTTIRISSKVDCLTLDDTEDDWEDIDDAYNDRNCDVEQIANYKSETAEILQDTEDEWAGIDDEHDDSNSDAEHIDNSVSETAMELMTISLCSSTDHSYINELDHVDLMPESTRTECQHREFR